MPKIRFAMALHNHQPVGNFGGVIEAAYRDSYLPFLEVLEKYPQIPFSLHTSGCLVEWLVEQHPEYIERVKHLVERRQVEILGGGYYEPILPMIPSRDRQGQIRGFTEYLNDLFGCQVRGMWTPERVWEQCLVSDIAEAGIEYTILDDYHFRKAGLRPDQLHGYYLTEDEGRVLRIFPGSEPMRYTIPFQDVHNTINYLRDVHQRHPSALVVFADDGEKFGTWPETKAHVYEHGWIYRFLDALRDNQDWIEICTVGQALDALEPVGQVYLPDCSYREMTEWALPPQEQLKYDWVWHKLDRDPDGAAIKEFMKGGFWRNFKAKYTETNEMYARMMQVSRYLERLCAEYPDAFSDMRVHEARQDLYRGQCNCSYWHGAFGGLYLPHLRNAVYSRLIAAENRLLAFERGGDARFVDAHVEDMNFDGRDEVRLENESLVASFAPAQGGQLYELDVRAIAINLGASLSRRPESYHEKIRQAGSNQNNAFGSIHDRVVFKQAGLDQKLIYDWYPRKSLIDHFYEPDASLAAVEAGQAAELGDFVTGKYFSQVYADGEEVSVSLSRAGKVGDSGVTVRKTVWLSEGRGDLRIRYRLEDLPQRELTFAVEFNFAALASGADDRYFHDRGNRRLGQLGTMLDLADSPGIGLVDQWLGIDVGLKLSEPGGIWTFPIQTVSQSEGGFELVHQSVCVMPHWRIPAGVTAWEVQLSLALDTSMAEARKLATVG